MAITYLGGAASQSAGGACTITLGVGVSVRQGIIVISCVDTNSAPQLPQDTGGNTYTSDESFHNSGGVIQIGLTHSALPLTTALSVGNTISLSGAISGRQAWHAYAIDYPIGFDGTPFTNDGEGRSDAGTAVSNNLQSLTTLNANDYLFAGVVANVNTTLTGVTAGWNAPSTPSVVSDTGMILFAFSQLVAATGTYNLSGTLGATAAWVLVNAGYKFTLPVGIRPQSQLFPKTIMRR